MASMTPGSHRNHNQLLQRHPETWAWLLMARADGEVFSSSIPTSVFGQEKAGIQFLTSEHQFKLLGMTAKAHCLYHVLFCSWTLSSREGRISSLVLWEGGLGLNWAQADASLSPVCLVSPQMFFGVCWVELPCKNLRFTNQKAQQGRVLVPFSETQGDILERKWAANSWNWDLWQGIINQT